MTSEAKWSDFRNLDRERAVTAVHELLPKWVAILLVVAIAWQLARIVWMLVPGAAIGDPIEARPARAAGTAPSAAGGVDVQAIAAAHLFGRADPAAAPTAAPPPQEVHEDLAETRLNLSLRGTIAATEGEGSMAIIAAQGRDETVYAISDTVLPGTTLHAVYPDRVILNRGGALEALKLPKEFPEGGPTVRRSVPTTTEAPDPTPSIQQVVTQNVTKLADVIRPTPYFVGGEQQGYRVYPGRDRKQFAALGLRPGDLIKSVNGASLTDPQQAMEIFQNLGSADQVTVTVERNGQPQVLTLSTAQLTLDNEQ
ncbi:MAG TPA: type II secretion system protein GspC [Woeseiaceae bacterium]|nr:type II secretion system protein GspC [Woeseiaceae bacterium]